MKIIRREHVKNKLIYDIMKVDDLSFSIVDGITIWGYRRMRTKREEIGEFKIQLHPVGREQSVGLAIIVPTLIPRPQPPNIRYIVSASCWTTFKYPPRFGIFSTVVLHETSLTSQLITLTN